MRTFLVSSLTACLVIGATGNGARAPAERESGMAVRLTVATPRPAYGPGDTIAVDLTLRNPDGPAETLRFATGQRYDVELWDEGDRPLWRWSEGRMFTQMLGQERLGPGDSLTYQVALPAPATPGQYRVVGRIPAMERPLEASVGIRVE
jgi:Intracellular proteinase inhibitor